MISPSLTIRRVVVDGALSLDLSLNKGLNVIHAVQTGRDERSTNKAGKTALVELIQYGLGRRQKSKKKYYFAPIQDQIDTLWLEIEANGRVVTIERSLQNIFGQVAIRETEFFPNIRDIPSAKVSVDDLSSVLLKLLGIPQVLVKMKDGKLTPLSFPNLTRTFILHQEDSFSAILDKVLPEQRKADIIGFVTQITPIERFTIEPKLGKLQSEITELEAYLNSVRKFIAAQNLPTRLEAEKELELAEDSLASAKQKQYNMQCDVQRASRLNQQNKGMINNLHRQLISVKKQASEIEESFLGLEQEEKNLKMLIASLQLDQTKAQRLQTSTTILSSVEFTTCPRCLLEITNEMKRREQYARCMLCNRPLRSNSDAQPIRKAKTDDIEWQIEEAEAILSEVRRERKEKQKELQKLHHLEEKLGWQLNEEMRVYVSPVIDCLRAQAHEVARLEIELFKKKNTFEQVQTLYNIEDSLLDLQHEKEQLEKKLKEAKKASKEQLSILEELYYRVLSDINYPNISQVNINPRTLMPNINGYLYRHSGAALTGVATTCYHLALLQLACYQHTYFPQLLVIDSPAVADLNKTTEKQLLNYLASLQDNLSSGTEPDWQIILTTRTVVPELKDYIRYEISASPGKMLLRPTS